MQNIIVIKDYQTEYLDPIALKKYDEVECGEESNEYPNWIYCKSLNTKKEGWVPKQILTAQDEFAKSQAIEDYSAKELTVKKDEILTALKHLNNWTLCKAQTGEIGWIPTENLKSL